MAHNYHQEDWELRSFSSGKLKKSSSVEILLGTHPTRGRYLATDPTSSSGLVTSHKMKGSGRPVSTSRAGTLPASCASCALPVQPVQNGGAAEVSAKDSETVAPQAVQGKETKTAVQPELTATHTPLWPLCEASPPPPPVTPLTSALMTSPVTSPLVTPLTPVISTPVTPLPSTLLNPVTPLAPGPVTSTPVTSTLVTPLIPTPVTSTLVTPLIPTPVTSTLVTPLVPVPVTSTLVTPLVPTPVTSTSVIPLTSTPAASTPVTSAAGPREAGTPPIPPSHAPHTPPLSRLKNVKDKGSHLPPLVTTHKPEYQSPVGTPRTTPKSTPKGTPIIGKRGHVFSVSTPEVEPETGQPLQPLPLDAVRSKRTVTESLSDPFVLRRKMKPTAEAEGKEKEGGGGGAGEGEGEPVWQRRLSLLFVPPTEDELEPEKEPEETTRLLPLIIKPHILRKQSVDSVPSPPRSRRKDREDRVSKKKEKEAKKEAEAKEVKKTKEEEEDQPKPARINFEEERNRKTEEDKKRKGREDEKKDNTVRTKFSALRRSSISDEPASSASSMGGSDEEENEEVVEEGREQGDDYTSWDDTICSNRSSYFKKYYTQRGVIGRASEDKEIGFRSPFNTSHNSLSSLIREKMGKSPPSQGNRTTQIGLVVLVVVLVVVIIVGISLTHYFYHLHLLELSIFNRIKFYEGQRHLEVYDPSWEPIMTLHLGTNLPKYSIPEDCTHYLHYLQEKNYTLPHHGLDDDEYEDMICLDWTALAQLHLRKLYAAGNVQCYTVWWVALKQDFTLRDCLMSNTSEPSHHNITWWGGGEMTSGGYPITRADVAPEEMVTGRLEGDQWGQLLRRMWLSDRATLLMLPARFRGRVSVNHELDKQVCLEMPVTACTTADPNLSYTLCTAPNVTALAGYLHQRAVQERHVVGLAMPSLVNYSMEEPQQQQGEGETRQVSVLRESFTEEVVTRVEERLQNPVWIPWMTPDSPFLTQEAVLSYVDRALNNSTGGHVLLPPSWQTRPGELEFDPERFPDPVALSETLRDKGFQLALTLHPFVSVDAPGFSTGMMEGLWVRQSNSLLPALARYDERHPTVVTDFSNPRARHWYAQQLQALKDKYRIDRFHLHPADSHALPTYHEYHMSVPSSDNTMTYFMASVSSVSPPVSTEGAIMPPLPPTFVTLGTGDGSWKALETLVPRALTLAMLGFPFIDVGPIGGLARAGHVPDRELYIRWIEAATFLPAMQISVLPSTYGEEVAELAREYQDIRSELVLPRLMDKVQDALEHGTPLITPLALYAPDDPEARAVDDQWMLGDDLLVAPVTRRGERTRTFYLPKGIWKDVDGNLKNGGRWVNNYNVPLTKIPHFIRKYVDDFET